jgi:hypothetical protein
MDANSAINTIQEISKGHPSLALGIILIFIGVLARGKVALIFYALGALAILKEFGLVGTFFSFLKGIPTLLKGALGLGGV